MESKDATLHATLAQRLGVGASGEAQGLGGHWAHNPSLASAATSPLEGGRGAKGGDCTSLSGVAGSSAAARTLVRCYPSVARTLPPPCDCVDLTLSDDEEVKTEGVKMETADAVAWAAGATCVKMETGAAVLKRPSGDDPEHAIELLDEPDEPRFVLKKARTHLAVNSAEAAAPAMAPSGRRHVQKALRSASVNGLAAPLVNCGLHSDNRGGSAYEVGSGLSVHFPLPPQPPQLAFMATLAEALRDGMHALLESPTGTGKSLAALSTLMAHQHRIATLGVPEDVPRLFWVARTHVQLEHAMHELRRVAYWAPATILAGRERLCLHPPALVRGADRALCCEKATYKKDMDCVHLANAEAIGFPDGPKFLALYDSGGPLAAMDIEDMVREGKARVTCPYHASRDITTLGAGVIMLTYGQLLCPSIRAAINLNLLLKNSVVIFDEAHNVPGAARQAASLDCNAPELELVVLDCRKMEAVLAAFPGLENKRDHLDTLGELRIMVSKLRAWLLRETSAHGSRRWVAQDGSMQCSESDDASARRIVTEVLGFSKAALKKMSTRIRSMRAALIEANFESTAVKSRTINALEDLVTKLHMLLDATPDAYKLLVTRQCSNATAATAQQIANAERRQLSWSPPPFPQFSLVCLLGAVALRPVRELARSLAFMSGTLGPAQLFADEMELGRVEGEHRAHAQHPSAVKTLSTAHHTTIGRQFLPIALAVGRPLTVKNRRAATEILFPVGDAVVQSLKHIPHGTLVFFPSSEMLSQCIETWKAVHLDTGRVVWAEIHAGGRAVFEDCGGGSEASKSTLASFRAAALRGPAVLFAVLRSRASEGTDFKDDAARGVIVIGVPLLPTTSPSIRLKRDYNNMRVSSGDWDRQSNGHNWYMAEGIRCAAQSLGRVIRHANDFGVAILLDCRYSHARASPGEHGVRSLLPAFVQPLLQVVTSSQELQHILPPFFSARKAEAEEAAAAASAALSTGAAPIKQEQELEAIDPEF